MVKCSCRYKRWQETWPWDQHMQCCSMIHLDLIVMGPNVWNMLDPIAVALNHWFALISFVSLASWWRQGHDLFCDLDTDGSGWYIISFNDRSPLNFWPQIGCWSVRCVRLPESICSTDVAVFSACDLIHVQHLMWSPFHSFPPVWLLSQKERNTNSVLKGIFHYLILHKTEIFI